MRSRLRYWVVNCTTVCVVLGFSSRYAEMVWLSRKKEHGRAKLPFKKCFAMQLGNCVISVVGSPQPVRAIEPVCAVPEIL